jgi:broad specificity phosphatase PhoE
MHIYLVRHTEYHNPGKIFAFHLPFNLSEKGKHDALKIGLWFKDQDLLELPIFSSPIVRTLETAEIIASQINSKITTDSRLSETSCPDLQGIKIPEINSWILEEDDPSREPHASVLRRMVNIYTEKTNEGKDCILVSHGDPLTLLYYHLIRKTPPHYFWDPQNNQLIYQRGGIVDIKIRNNKIISINKI